MLAWFFSLPKQTGLSNQNLNYGRTVFMFAFFDHNKLKNEKEKNGNS